MPPRDVRGPRRRPRAKPSIGPPAPKRRARGLIGPPAPKAAGPAGPVGKQLTDPKLIAHRARQQAAALAGKHLLYGEAVKEVDKPLLSIGPLHLGSTATYQLHGKDVTGQVLKQQHQQRLARQSGVDKSIASVTTPVLRDYININAEAIPSLYHLGATAATGHPVKAAQMLAEPYKQFLADPVKSFKEHPLGTALLFAGPKSLAGRGAGRAMRLAPEGSVLERAASRSRTSATLPGTSLVKLRRYSPDVISKGFQVARERSQMRRSTKLQEQATRASRAGDDEAAVHFAQEAHKADPTRIQPQEIRRRMDERVDANEQVRRLHRTMVTRAVDTLTKRHDTPALSLVAQGIVKPTTEDLLAYHDELAAQYKTLKRASHKRANTALRQQIQEAIRQPKKLQGIEEAAHHYERLTGSLQRKLVDAGMLAEGQANMSKLIPYAVRRMGAKMEDGRIVDAEGRPLAADDIRAHMRATDTPEPAYVTQAPKSGSGYFVAQHEAPRLPTSVRTGEATRKGVFDAGPETLREGAARMQGLVDAHEGFSRTVNEFGLRDRGGAVRTVSKRGDAMDLARELEARGEGKWRPIRLQPFAGKDAQLHDLLEKTRSDIAPEHETIREAISSAIDENARGEGPWGLVPDAAARQLSDHIRVLGSGGAGKLGQLFNTQFRKTVLATSPKWLLGNVAEAGLRAAIDRAGPRSWYVGRQALKTLEEENPAAAEELAVRGVGGGHYAMSDRTPRRSAQQFQGTRVEGTANKLATFWTKPGPKQLADAWHAWTHLVFDSVNRRVEAQFQTAMAGAHIRRTLMDDHMLKTSKAAIDDAVKGLHNTETQVELARQVDRAYGQYSKFNPNMRRALVLYTPFAAWTINALRFLVDVLPRDHPALMSVLASAHIASQEWRKEHGLDKFMSGRVPDFLQGSIPTSGGGKLRATRYTPFSLATDPLGTAAGALLPQVSGVVAAMKGQDWTGRPLRAPDGGEPDDLQKGRAAAMAFLEATVPLAGQAQQLAQAPGGVVQKARKVYDPFLPTRSKKKAGRGRAPKKGVSFGGATSGPKVTFGAEQGSSSGVTFGGG